MKLYEIMRIGKSVRPPSRYPAWATPYKFGATIENLSINSIRGFDTCRVHVASNSLQSLCKFLIQQARLKHLDARITTTGLAGEEAIIGKTTSDAHMFSGQHAIGDKIVALAYVDTPKGYDAPVIYATIFTNPRIMPATKILKR